MRSHSFWTRLVGSRTRVAIGAALSLTVGAGWARLGPAVAAPAAQSLSVQIYADRIDPDQLTIEASSTVLFTATNNTSMDCTFYIEGLLSSLLVPAGGSVQNSFEVSNLPPSADTTAGAATGGPSDSGSVAVPMGCRGVTAQTGSAIVQRQPGT